MLAADVLTRENLLNGLDFGLCLVARLVIYHANALAPQFRGHGIEAVDGAADLECALRRARGESHGVEHFQFQSEYCERRVAAVKAQQLAHVAHDDIAVDELQTVVFGPESLPLHMEEFFPESVVHHLLNAHFAFQIAVDVALAYRERMEELRFALFIAGHVARSGKREVDILARLVEDVAEDAVVDGVFIGGVWFLDVGYVAVEETFLAAQIGVDGRGREACKPVELFLHSLVFRDVGLLLSLRFLAGLQAPAHYRVPAFHHELEHEAAHLARVAVFRGIVVGHGHVGGPLNEAVEVVGIDGHLVVDSGEPVGMAYGIGDERGVVDAFGQVALVGREQQHVVEVEVAGFEHAHHLYAHHGFAVERYAGRLKQLAREPLQRGRIHREVARVHEFFQAVEKRVAAEE